MTTTLGDVAVPIVLSDEFVRVVNTDDHDLPFCWAAKNYLVKQGGEGFIPWEAMVQSFGDPRAGLEERPDTLRNGHIPARAFELRRLGVFYGVGEGFTDGRSPVAVTQERGPKAEIYSLGGDRIITVLDDPEGDSNINPVNDGTPNDPRTLRAMIQKQEQQMTYMRQALDSMQKGQLTTVDAIPEDEPGGGMGTPQAARNSTAGMRANDPPAMPKDES